MLIGHIDSGIQRDALLLQRRIAHFRAVDRRGLSTTPLLAQDHGTHGTCTASILFGGHYPGLPSLSDEVRLCSVALESQRRAILMIAAAIDALLEFDVRIAFMPVGVQQRTPVFVPLIEALCQRGTLVIAPIGNVGEWQACAPGYYEQVLSVGAMDPGGSALPLSGSLRDDRGHCRKPDIMAPGRGIPGMNRAQGTSIASAYAAGVASRLWHAHPEAGAADIWRAMVSTAKSSGPLQGHCRWGALQPVQALAYLDAPGLGAPSRPADESSVHVDPRLVAQLAGKPSAERLEALIVPRAWREGQRGHAVQLIDDVTRRVGEAPIHLRPFVHADMAHVGASRRFIEALAEHPDLLIASAVDVDAYNL